MKTTHEVDLLEVFKDKKEESVLLGGVLFVVVLALFAIALVVLGPEKCFGDEIGYADEQIAFAIYNAEGDNNAKYPYGIKSINTHGDGEYAHKICLNTIRNHRKRHANHICGKDFITCLGNRYCPPSAHSLNKNWVKNVKYFLAKEVI